MKCHYSPGLAALSLAALATPALAQEPFYKGKQITLIIGADIAGGYDTYGRLYARFAPRFIPGNPNIVVQIMPGAGGVIGANNLYNLAPKDGTTIGVVQRQIPQGPMLGMTGTQFDATKFQWIGSLNNEISICVSWHTTPVKTLRDAMEKELIVGAQRQANTEQYPAILNNILGTKFKIVSGYAGGNAVLLALERGEVEGRCSWSWSSIVVQKPDWLAEKKINLLTQFTLEKHPDLPNVPTVTEFVKTEEQRQTIEFLFASNLFGRPFLTPPGVPADRVETLRKAFDDMVLDKEVIAEFEKQKQELTPVSGRKLQEIVERLYKTPKDIIERAEKATMWAGTVQVQKK